MYLDILVGVILLFTILKGYSSGFFVGAISLFSIVVNVVIAKLATPKVMELLKIDGKEGTYYLFYALIFLGLYFLIGLLLALLKSFIKDSMRSGTDRFMGILLGFLKGVAISFILLLFYNLLGENFHNIKRYGEGSKANVAFKRAIPYVRDYFPERIGDRIESRKYRENVEKYLDNILKESGE
ncbi:hypothetical protein PM10SUCC1_10840 [Propionigenium maris DSM 9537]|uniref:Membrane protein required for colicin V production n=1 Tax=Propionigenium maris DSM 9537 TaxID=1123000 RepID=A0A9W6GK08_9FUSO|nr:CvpA family protein [Propionigenium maris]GLI55570.1 hypothetical protein PM10SUCC1_10840 [Propionigenium maris DSM 9537]